MGGSSKKQTVGYRYYMGMHLAICHGPVDAVQEIVVGDRQAWSGNVTDNARITINAPELFGGDSREGGVVGDVDIAFGGPTQTANDYLTAKAGSPQPAYRGILGLILRQVHITSNNPYIKPWAVRVKRCPRAWYPDKAEISGAANPAHIIHECLTNTAWGMGYPTSSIDEASFITAADTLYTEEFGLNLIWSRQATIEQFIRDVLDHVGGVLTVSPESGKFVLKLIRGDYNVNALPVFDDTSIIELESYQRAALGETVNEIVVVYTRPDTWAETSITVQDLANLQAQGSIVSQTRHYPGITSDALAARVAMRDLAAVSAQLAKVRFRVNRRAWNLMPGDLFRLSWPQYGIDNLVMRVASIDGGTLTDGAISVDAIEDVFGLPAASYSAQQPTGWTNPVPSPQPATPSKLVEAPYWDIARTLSAAELAYLDATDCHLQTLAGRPTPGAINYELWTKTASASSYTQRGTAEFAPYAYLAADIGQAVSSTISYTGDVDVDIVAVGGYAYIDDEAVAITAIDLAAKTLTVDRGVMDTVPAPHTAGAVIWFADGYQGVDPTEYAPGETVNAKMLTITGRGKLALASAPEDALVMARRQNRPYPPGNVRLNGESYPQAIQDDLTITWAHRDRLSQTANLVRQDVGNIGPESGVTYTLRIYGETNTLQRTYSGLTGTSQDYTMAQDEADSGLGRPNGMLRIELEADRGGITSLQRHSITVDRAGYGLQWGKYYGGL